MSERINLGNFKEELGTVTGLDTRSYGDGLIITMPCSYDRLILSPSRTSRKSGIFWQHQSSKGAPTGRHGYLPWPSEARSLIDFVIQYSYSLEEYGRQYGGVLNALRATGLDARLLSAEAGGFLIHIPLHQDGYLVIASPLSLPPRLEQVTGWRVEHYADHDFRSLIIDRVPEEGTRNGVPGGSDVAGMVNSVARYVKELLVRRTGPLRGTPQGMVAPETLAWLMEEMAALPSHIAPDAGGGSVIVTISRPGDGPSVSVTLPAGVVNRLSALVLAEVTTNRANGR